MNMRRFFENVGVNVMSAGAWPSAATNQGWISLSQSHRIAFIAILNTLGVDGTVSLEVWQAKNAAGLDAKVINDGDGVCAINNTQLVNAAGGLGWVGIDLEASRLDINNGYAFVTLRPSEAATGALVGTFIAILHAQHVMPVVQESQCKGILFYDG